MDVARLSLGPRAAFRIDAFSTPFLVSTPTSPMMPSDCCSATCTVTGNVPGTEGPLLDPTCSDGIDNDCDDATDGADTDCQ